MRGGILALPVGSILSAAFRDRMRRIIPHICAVVVFLTPALPRAQTPEPSRQRSAQARLLEADSVTIFFVTLKDGSAFVARVRAIRNDSVVLISPSRVRTVPLEDVRKSRVLREQDLRNGDYWFPNPNRTRLVFGPTGRMLDKGDGYFSTFALFLPEVTYGITNLVSIGGGISLFPTDDLSDQLLYLTPKVGVIQSDKLNVAVGGLMISGPGRRMETVGIVYGVGTVGSENASVTAGLGYGYQGSKIGTSPVVLIGAEYRVRPGFGLITENYLIAVDSESRISLTGLRFFGEKMAFDAGAAWFPGSNGSYYEALPYVAFVINF